MKVNSPLANMKIFIGSVAKVPGGLAIESRDDSTMPAEVLIEPRDARDFVVALLKKPLSLMYVMIMPLMGFFPPATVSDDNVGNGPDDSINKPW